MIKLPSQQEYSELKEFDEPFCLTVYAPFINPNAATNPNNIELKNLLREAETALLSAGVELRKVKKTLKPAYLLAENPKFWPPAHAGLALFMHPELFRYYHLPNRVSPYQLTVEKGFNLQPLQKVMDENKQYYVLALGHKNVRLYRGDYYQLRRVQLKDFPDNMKGSLDIDEYPKWRETHAIAPTYMGKGSEAFHGQYNVSQTDKNMLREFFRRIDHRLHSVLVRHQKPLIVAGVNYLIPIYKKVNTYPGLMDRAILGNQQYTDLQTIRQKARLILKSNQ